MYTSDIEKNSKKALNTAFTYLLISVFCALFGGVYELFSHGIYSYYMLYAFAFPLVLGALPFLIIGRFIPRAYPSHTAQGFHHSAIATATVGSVVMGVLEIYGTTNRLTDIYIYASGILLVVGIIIYTLQLLKKA